jgi:hypothetical protein
MVVVIDAKWVLLVRVLYPVCSLLGCCKIHSFLFKYSLLFKI